MAFLLFGILKIRMKKFKILLTTFLTIGFTSLVAAKNIPESFADLAERLMPSVVNI